MIYSTGEGEGKRITMREGRRGREQQERESKWEEVGIIILMKCEETKQVDKVDERFST